MICSEHPRNHINEFNGKYRTLLKKSLCPNSDKCGVDGTDREKIVWFKDYMKINK